MHQISKPNKIQFEVILMIILASMDVLTTEIAKILGLTELNMFLAFLNTSMIATISFNILFVFFYWYYLSSYSKEQTIEVAWFILGLKAEIVINNLWVILWFLFYM